MKFLTPIIVMLTAPRRHMSVRALLRLAGTFLLAVIVFTVLFDLVMLYEGREHGMWTGVYWSIVTMTTLGYGDIVFHSDLGRAFSLLVLLTGAVLLLVILPFTFIQYVYLPWKERQRRARAPRTVDDDVAGHVLVTGDHPMIEAVERRARGADVRLIRLVEDADEAVALADAGWHVLVGRHDEPRTYRAAAADRAEMVLLTDRDERNVNAAFTLRQVAEQPTVVATANDVDAIDVLELSGVDHVLHLGRLLAEAFARRILATDGRHQVVSERGRLRIAEALPRDTPLVGRRLDELALRPRLGVSVVAVWEHGELTVPRADLEIESGMVLVLAGTSEQLAAYDREVAGPGAAEAGGEGHVVILGGGRVGRALARRLLDVGIEAVLVERDAARCPRELPHVVGDASSREVLEEAGIGRATAVVVTTHDDAMNVYLTLYAHQLAPEAEILGRVRADRNLATSYRAGADVVLSYASIGAAEAWNAMGGQQSVLLSEGLMVVEIAVPPGLAGERLDELDLPGRLDARVLAVRGPQGDWRAPDPTEPLPADGALQLIGDEDVERRVRGRYGEQHETRFEQVQRLWREHARPAQRDAT